MNLDKTAVAGAKELNKSIELIARNVLIGLIFIAMAVYKRK